MTEEQTAFVYHLVFISLPLAIFAWSVAYQWGYSCGETDERIAAEKIARKDLGGWP